MHDSDLPTCLMRALRTWEHQLPPLDVEQLQFRGRDLQLSQFHGLELCFGSVRRFLLGHGSPLE